MNQIVQNAQIPPKNNIPKIISGSIATIVITVVGRLLFSAFWFWAIFETVAALLVVVGCSGEWYLHHHPAGRKKREKDEHHKVEARFIAMVAIGVIMELFSLGHSISEGAKLETENKILHSNVLVLETNLQTLNGRTLELAHEYDLSTNALAEANARLKAIHPLKELLIDCLNRIDPSIMRKLKARRTPQHFESGENGYVDLALYLKLQSLSMEPDAEKFIKFTPDLVITQIGGRGEVKKLNFDLYPSLLEP